MHLHGIFDYNPYVLSVARASVSVHGVLGGYCRSVPTRSPRSGPAGTKHVYCRDLTDTVFVYRLCTILRSENRF